MNGFRCFVTSLAVVSPLLCCAGAATASDQPAIIPTPKSLKLTGGSIDISLTSRILYGDAQLEPLAKVLADDIRRIHGLELAVAKGTAPDKGDILLKLGKVQGAEGGFDVYSVTVAGSVTVQGESYNDLAMGMMTVVQAARSDGKVITIPHMTIRDWGDRGFRALQVDIRSGYHPPQWVKQVIDVMRFYKVRVLQLHTTESLWVGAVMESSNGADTKLLHDNFAWTKKEMGDVIAYAKQRGVSLVPHNEMRPNDPYWPAALTLDFNPSDKFTCYVDEVDHQGKYQIKGNLANDARFWNFVKVVTQRSYEQFGAGWPGGKLPCYHIGPVYGEGGCNGKEAVRMLSFLVEKNPDIRMMYWNGPGEKDPDLSPHKKNLCVQFYSAQWGGTPEGLLQAGYPLVNASWTPLYILPGNKEKARAQAKWIFDEFQLARFGAEGKFGEPIKASDCNKMQAGVIGALLPTWEFGGPTGHLDMIVPCIPYFAEHIWNVQPFPYPKGAWERMSNANAQLEPLLQRVLKDTAKP